MVGFSEYFFSDFQNIFFLSLESIWNNRHIHSFIESLIQWKQTGLFSLIS